MRAAFVDFAKGMAWIPFVMSVAGFLIAIADPLRVNILTALGIFLLTLGIMTVLVIGVLLFAYYFLRGLILRRPLLPPDAASAGDGALRDADDNPA